MTRSLALEKIGSIGGGFLANVIFESSGVKESMSSPSKTLCVAIFCDSRIKLNSYVIPKDVRINFMVAENGRDQKNASDAIPVDTICAYVIWAEHVDAHHNLDLGLWISPPCNSQRGNNSVRNNQPPLQLTVEESKSFRERSMTLLMIPNKVVTVHNPLESLKKKTILANEVSASV
ncbi:hypothetical protein AgCh_023035 [Apium graveolens]